MAVINPKYQFFAYLILSLPHEDTLKKKTKMNGRYSVTLILKCSNIVGFPVFHFTSDILVINPSKNIILLYASFESILGLK